MLFGRYGAFSGGIDLPDEKQATLGSAIRPCRRPNRLLVPLAAEGVAPADAIVTPGQRVRAGDRIALRQDDQGVNVYAPLGGKIVAVTTAGVIGAAGFLRAPAVEMGDLSDPPILEAPKEVFDYRSAGPEALLERIDGSDLLTHRCWPRPLRRWVRRGREHRCALLIVNAMESQPRVTADHRLLAELGRQVVAGMTILARAAGVKATMLAVDRRRTGDYRELVGPAREAGIQLMALSHKYPIGADAILVKVLARREVPLGSNPMRVGCMVIDAATCLAVWREVACGAPLTGRVVTVAGETVADPGNYYVPFGTPCRELVGAPDGMLLHGGPMIGSRCPADAVVTAATDAVLGMKVAAPPASSPCIRCGWCTDHCPARLNVSALNDAFELGMLEEARRAGVAACVQCGICSYVCPARLPLAQRAKQLKGALAAQGRPVGGLRP
jgi:electron transport complex protein RnfC